MLLVCSKCTSLYETHRELDATVLCSSRSCKHPLLPAHKDARISWVRSIIDSHEE